MINKRRFSIVAPFDQHLDLAFPLFLQVTRFSLRIAAGAAGFSTEKPLRNWVQRGQIGRQPIAEAGQHWFWDGEIAQLAVARRLAGFGIDIAQAFAIAQLHCPFKELSEGDRDIVLTIEDEKVVLLAQRESHHAATLIVRPTVVRHQVEAQLKRVWEKSGYCPEQIAGAAA